MILHCGFTMCDTENVIQFMKQFIMKILKEKFGRLFPRYLLVFNAKNNNGYSHRR